LPPATISSASNNGRNQLLSWNGVSATYSNRGDLTGDPTNGATLTWNERNQLSTINSTAYSFLYDAFGRRQAFDDLGVTETYLYDALQAVQTTIPTQNCRMVKCWHIPPVRQPLCR
jgi:hypothetical protein